MFVVHVPFDSRDKPPSTLLSLWPVLDYVHNFYIFWAIHLRFTHTRVGIFLMEIINMYSVQCPEYDGFAIFY